jgi:hypothetical protein
MPIDNIVTLLIAERDRLNAAIEVLGGTTTKRRGRPPGSGVKRVEAVAEPAAKTVKTTWTPAKREAARKRAKAMWAKRKKAAKRAA